MKIKYFIMTILLLLVPIVTFGAQEVPEVDLTNVNTLIAIAMPLLTLASTWLLKKIVPAITGVYTLVAVPVLAGVITLLAPLVVDESLPFVVQLLTGAGAVLLHQLYRGLATPTTTPDNN
jgi:hypothetical protein